MKKDPIRYPIGQFKPTEIRSTEDRREYLIEIDNLMPTLRGILKDYHSEQLHTPYRLGGWTIQQVIHHMADNDMNAYKGYSY